MMIFLLFGRGDAIVAPNVQASESRREGGASLVVWLCALFNVYHLPMPIDVRDRTVHAVPVAAVKKERVYFVEDGNANERGT